MRRHIFLLPLAALLWACSSTSSPPSSAAPTAGALPPTSAPTLPPPTSAPPTARADTAPAAEAAAPTPAVEEHITAEGYHALGRADAPSTIVMYSDVF